MIYLKKFNNEDYLKEYEFFQKFESENGFENPYSNISLDEFKNKVLKERKESKKGINLKEGHVPDTYFFLYKNEEIIGLFKFRHYLNDFLKDHSGHIGYFILPSFRNKGYAKEGLKLLIEYLKLNKLYKEDELYFECYEYNKASINTILSNDGYIHHYDNGCVYLRIPLNNDKKYNSIPLTEFDGKEEQFLESENIFLRFKKEDKAIICYFHEVIDRLEKENIITFYSEIRGENSLFIYQFNDNKDIFIIKGLVGEPLIGGFIHLLITNGLKNILFIGGGGSLIPSNVGDLVLIDGAIRDEGFSFFYEPPSRIIYSNKDIVIKIENELRRKNIPYKKGLSWSIDSMYRETKSRVNRRKEEGAIVVEMEQAGLIALTKYFKVNYGAIIYFGDDLSNNNHKWRKWQKGNNDSRYNLVFLAKEIIEKY